MITLNTTTTNKDNDNNGINGTDGNDEGLFSSKYTQSTIPSVSTLLVADNSPKMEHVSKQTVIEVIEEVGRGLEDTETIQNVENS